MFALAHRRTAITGATRVSALFVLSALGAAVPIAADDPPRLSLRALLEEAKAASPLLRGAEARIAAAEPHAEHVRALPDPMLSLGFQNESLDDWTLGDTDMSNVTLEWSQELPGRGKRQARADAARAESGVAVAEARRVRTDLLAQIKAAYVRLHRIHRVRLLIEGSQRIVATLRDASRASFEAGSAPLEGALGAGAEFARLEADLVELDGERAESEARLAALLGRLDTGTFGRAVEPPVEAPWNAPDLAREASEGSARVEVLSAAERRDRARITSLDLETKADYSWSAAYGYRESLDPIVGAMFGVRLPLYRERKRLGVSAAEHELRALREETADAKVAAAAEARATVARAEASAASVRLLEQAVLPQTRAALEAATAAYTTGRADFGTLLGYVRATLEDERRVEELHERRRLALAALEPVLGRELLLPAEDAR